MAITLIMIIGSLGFLVMGLVNLFSNKLKEFFVASGMYKEVESFMKYSAIFNFIIGAIGILLGILNYIFYYKSMLIIIIYILMLFIINVIQRIVLKKYRNF